MLTQGDQGLWFRDPATRSSGRLAAYQIEPVDETAAGDAFVGYLLAGLVAGQTLQDSLKQASAAGALATTRAGAAPSVPRREQVDTLVAAQQLRAQEL